MFLNGCHWLEAMQKLQMDSDLARIEQQTLFSVEVQN